jgi:anti-anti-sigma factor
VKLSTRTQGAAKVLEPLGSIDGRGAIEFEQKLAEMVGVAKEPSWIVIDFSAVEVLSGAGLRVLVTISNRLSHQGGAMCLSNLAEHLHNVIEIAGLANHFRVADTVEAAAAQLATIAANPKTPAQQARVITALTDRAILLLEYEASDQPVDPTIVRRAIYAPRGRQNLGPVATYAADLLDPS